MCGKATKGNKRIGLFSAELTGRGMKFNENESQTDSSESDSDLDEEEI